MRVPSRTRITDWPPDDRPREKLLGRGAGALTDAELLALLIRCGTGGRTALDVAHGILAEARTLRSLAGLAAQELMRVPGIGPAKAVAMVAAFEIGRRVQAGDGCPRVIIRSPEDAARVMIPRVRDQSTERFYALLLDSMNGLKREVEVTSGTLNASLVHPREVFKAAIDHRAAGLIVIHNHPSGNGEPSREDIQITRQLAEAGKVVGIPLHDHIIIAGDRFTSLAERGLLG
ncbi:MAG: DNA repair protein RadC [Bacteroidota bacterium]